MPRRSATNHQGISHCLQSGRPAAEMWCLSKGSGIFKKLSPCYSIVYCYNIALKYKQFLQVSRLYRALMLLGVVPCLPSISVSSVFTVLYIYRVNHKKRLKFSTLENCCGSWIEQCLQYSYLSHWWCQSRHHWEILHEEGTLLKSIYQSVALHQSGCTIRDPVSRKSWW